MQIQSGQGIKTALSEHIGLKMILKGILVSYIITVPAFILFAFILSCTDFPVKYVRAVVILVSIGSIAIAGAASTRKVKSKLESIGGLAVTSTFTKNIEINNKEAQKGLILAKVAKIFGIKKEEVMVIGDSFNDYSMFTEFTESVAMENAIPQIKEIAKYITDTNDNAGVAKAIYKALNL
jgi:3-deoxy-D-manno-octulosonate 8-phosphate phosphatase KdsC-like HAD superfamily phosphatase